MGGIKSEREPVLSDVRTHLVTLDRLLRRADAAITVLHTIIDKDITASESTVQAEKDSTVAANLRYDMSRLVTHCIDEAESIIKNVNELTNKFRPPEIVRVSEEQK